ncbi:MAG: hypothetical protein V4590_10935 [Bacteroidota bacterium]
MKHSLLFTLLLGFGLVAPLTCAKQKDKKSSAEEHKQHNGKQPQKMVLYAPAGTIKQAQGRV